MVFKALSQVKIKVEFKPVVDNFVFRLHYRYTFAIFMVCVILTTIYDSMDDEDKRIDCISPIDTDEFKDVVNSYCFIMGTFTVDRYHSPKEASMVPHPGVGPLWRDEPVTYHAYYQWVPFVLFLQGVMFYIPHWLWKVGEGGMFRSIIQRLSIRDYLGDGISIENYFTKDTQFAALSTYIKTHMKNQRSWALKFFFCEFLNLVVVIGMVFFTDRFLGGEFLMYGAKVIEVLGQDPENRTDPMSRVFPIVTKCTFKYFGPSGTIQIYDLLCVVATNILNEKIYVFLWVWLLILTAITCIWLLCRLLTMCIPRLREFLLRMCVLKHVRKEASAILSRYSSLSEWLLIMQLGLNMDEGIFSEFILFFANDISHPGDEFDIDDPSKRKLSMSYSYSTDFPESSRFSLSEYSN